MGEGQSAGTGSWNSWATRGGALGWDRVTGLRRLVPAPSVVLQTAIECLPFARPWAWWVETPVPPGASRFRRREGCEQAQSVLHRGPPSL